MQEQLLYCRYLTPTLINSSLDFKIVFGLVCASSLRFFLEQPAYSAHQTLQGTFLEIRQKSASQLLPSARSPVII